VVWLGVGSTAGVVSAAVTGIDTPGDDADLTVLLDPPHTAT
jgi:hypothetical protein